MIYFIRPINRDFVSAHSEEFRNKILTFVKLVNEAGSSLFELTETVESEVFQAIKTGDAEKLKLYAIRFSNILGLSANDIFGKTEITGSVVYNPTEAKMRYLDRFLKERKGITLARAIAVSDE